MNSFKKFLNKKTKSVEQLAAKHKTSAQAIEKQLKLGIKTEKEHTSDSKVALEIAKAHVDEMPDYYNKLKKMEKQ